MITEDAKAAETIEPSPNSWRLRLAHVRAITRLVCALAASALTALLLPAAVSPQVRAVAAWDGFALVALTLTWLTILTLRPAQIARLAKREDPSRIVSLILVVLGAAASLLAVLVLLQESMTMARSAKTLAIRRTALLHGVVAFAFNTAVVALSIGVLSTLL